MAVTKVRNSTGGWDIVKEPGTEIRYTEQTLTEEQKSQAIKNIGAMPEILKSSTEGSTKKFKLTVDDSGTLSAVEVTE